MKNHTILAGLILAFSFSTITWSQQVDPKITNWYNGSKLGMNTDKAYSSILKGKNSTTVVVAVIDSGIDVDHEDLGGQIWTNEDEIPNNGIDDDNNGYVDDMHGWNFLGNSEGENINGVRLEVTRIYAGFRDRFAGKSEEDIAPEDKEDFELYKETKEEVLENRREAKNETKDMDETMRILEEIDNNLKKKLGGDYNEKQLKKLMKDEEFKDQASVMYNLMLMGFTFDDLKEYIAYYEEVLEYNYNPDIDPRADVIGDDVSDFNDRDYGNNDYQGPDASHGTHCAGIIGAVRGNGVGNDGVASDVAIMSLRAVPNGDEWDKDIALAVRYAVDNGAQVINMSFGKSYSPEQEEMVKAFRYAEEKGVLVVHAAGNEASDNDLGGNYPCPQYPAMSSKFTNWIEVGASTRYKKAKFKKGFMVQEGIAADFSNYGDKMVDVFAPGHDIYSTVPDNEYDVFDGTSMAGPMVAGTAALIKSYYPDLDMFAVREIILESVQKTESQALPMPGDGTMVTLSELCVTGGIVNVYSAVELAESRSGGAK